MLTNDNADQSAFWWVQRVVVKEKFLSHPIRRFATVAALVRPICRGRACVQRSAPFGRYAAALRDASSCFAPLDGARSRARALARLRAWGLLATMRNASVRPSVRLPSPLSGRRALTPYDTL